MYKFNKNTCLTFALLLLIVPMTSQGHPPVICEELFEVLTAQFPRVARIVTRRNFLNKYAIDGVGKQVIELISDGKTGSFKFDDGKISLRIELWEEPGKIVIDIPYLSQSGAKLRTVSEGLNSTLPNIVAAIVKGISSRGEPGQPLVIQIKSQAVVNQPVRKLLGDLGLMTRTEQLWSEKKFVAYLLGITAKTFRLIYTDAEDYSIEVILGQPLKSPTTNY